LYFQKYILHLGEINTQEMLDSKLTLNPDSVEKFFCEPFDKLPLREMTDGEAKVLTSMFFAEEDGFGDSILNGKEASLSVHMLQKSLKYRFSFEMTQALMIMVAYLSESIGQIIMYLTYFQYKAKKLGKRKLNIEDFKSILPNGVPTEESLHDLWVATKVKRSENIPHGSDNLLDYQTALQSIHFTE
tara:strand:+ start:3430 stop:3990 length:561 start_codon:yes stop_codon:yes gene_type:complete